MNSFPVAGGRPLVTVAGEIHSDLDLGGRWEPDPLVRATAQTALTDMIGLQSSGEGVHHNAVAQILIAYAETEVKIKGRTYPACLPGLEQLARGGHVTGHTGAHALKRLGMTEDDIVELWSELDDEDDVERRFDERILRAYYDPEIEYVVAALVVDGPHVARKRIEKALNRVARTKRNPRTGQPLVRNTLANYSLYAKKLCSTLVTIAGGFDKKERKLRELHKWTAAPDDWKLPAAPSSTGTAVTVPGHIVRARFQEYSEIIAARLGTDVMDFDAQLRAVDELSVWQLRKARIFRMLIYRAMLILVCCLGLRATAACTIKDTDLVHDYTDERGDVGPALKVFERKTMHKSEWVYKPVPHELARCLEVTMRFTRRWARAQGKHIPAGSALLLNQELNPFNRGSMRLALAGARPDVHITAGKPAILRREGQPPWKGYSTHACRRRARQWIASGVGQQMLAARGFTLEKIQWIAEATLGHRDRDVRKIYGGAATPAEIASLAKVGIEIAWAMLTTDKGARREWNRTELTWAYNLELAAERELEQLALRRTELPRRRKDLREDRKRARDAGDFHAIDHLDDQIDAIDDDLDILIADERTTERTLDQARASIAFLERQDGMKAVPDVVPGNEYRAPDPDEPARIRDAVRCGKLTTGHVLVGEPNRCYFSVEELTELLGWSSATIRKAVTTGSLPNGEPLYAPEANERFTSWSTPRRRAILWDALNPGLRMFKDPKLLLDTRRLLATKRPAAWGETFDQLALER